MECIDWSFIESYSSRVLSLLFCLSDTAIRCILRCNTCYCDLIVRHFPSLHGSILVFARHSLFWSPSASHSLSSRLPVLSSIHLSHPLTLEASCWYVPRGAVRLNIWQSIYRGSTASIVASSSSLSSHRQTTSSADDSTWVHTHRGDEGRTMIGMRILTNWADDRPLI